MRRVEMLAVLVMIAVMSVMSVAGSVQANTIRYAVVVGSNVGLDTSTNKHLEPLLHAESEARRLRNDLVRYANADPSKARTVLLQRPSRARLIGVLKRLAVQVKSDRQAFGGKSKALFTFFFTGHGLRGQLLLKDGGVESKTISKLLKAVGADLTLAVFDACYSGSLDARSLREKGIEPSSGADLLKDLPKEVLRAQGQLWFVSSGPEEVSYEDAKLGGVFTHFFRRALRKAPAQGPGITLESIWRYTFDQTVHYTSVRRRKQTPRQLVKSLDKAGSVYFSFPAGRSAALELDAPLAGHFALSYRAGGLTQIIDKRRGKTLRLKVYPGRATWMQLVDGKPTLVAPLTLRAGKTVRMSAGSGTAPPPHLGIQVTKLWSKGPSGSIGTSATAPTLTAHETGDGWTVGLGATYEVFGQLESLLLPMHHTGAIVSLDRGSLTMDLLVSYGFANSSFDTWGYSLDAVVGELRVGWSWLAGPARFAIKGAARGGYLWQQYDSGEKRQAGLGQFGVIAELLIPTSGPLHGMIWARADLMVGSASADTPGTNVGFSGGGGLGLVVRLY